MTLPPPGCQRAAFRIPDHVHYLNCAYMAPLPRVVEDALVEGVRRKRLPTELHPDDFFAESDRVRSAFARLVGGPDPSRVALHPSVSYGVATAARNLPLERGRRVVILGEQFPGNVYAWRRRAQETGAEIRTVLRPPGAAPGARWNEALLAAIDDRTAVVAVPTVHWTDGTRFDLEAVGARCREVGAALVVDGTQSVGAVPFDVTRVRPDALVVAGYKWLLGPYSLALTWLGPRFDSGVPLEETWIARAGSEDFQHLVDYVDEYQPGAVRYDVGERSNFALLPGLLAALELLLDWTPQAISAYAGALTAPLLEQARSLGFGVEADPWRSAHLFGLRMPPGRDLSALRAVLEERDVYVSLRGASLRVSPHLYNDEADVRALAEVLATA
jgi:selenocysteine lyase/cysteine desulfurase